MALRIALVCFMVMGLVCLAFGLLELLSHGRVLIDDESHLRIVPSNLGDRMGWLFTTGALPALVVPILVLCGALPLDYYHASRIEKIRTDLAGCLASIPLMSVLVSLASSEECKAGLQCGKLAIVTIVYVAFFGTRLVQWKKRR